MIFKYLGYQRLSIHEYVNYSSKLSQESTVIFCGHSPCKDWLQAVFFFGTFRSALCSSEWENTESYSQTFVIPLKSHAENKTNNH